NLRGDAVQQARSMGRDREDRGCPCRRTFSYGHEKGTHNRSHTRHSNRCRHRKGYGSRRIAWSERHAFDLRSSQGPDDSAAAGRRQLFAPEAIYRLSFTAALMQQHGSMSQASPIAIERPRTQSKARLLLIPARIILGAVFIYAAYAKLHFNGAWHLRDYYFFFAMGIDSYKMLPLAIVEWMARILPWLELGLGTLLIVGAGVRWVGLMVTALLVVFMAALAHAALGGLEINCGCFGKNSGKPN